jgi:hypothetical protein
MWAGSERRSFTDMATPRHASRKAANWFFAMTRVPEGGEAAKSISSDGWTITGTAWQHRTAAPPTAGPETELTAAQQDEARRRRAQGATLAELARSYGVGKSTISRLTP